MCKSFCATPPSSFLSGHAVVQFQSATLFLVEECKEQVKASRVKKLNINSAPSVVIYSILRCQMARTRVNTTVLAKTLLFAGFRSRHDLRFFEKRVNTSVFLRSSRQKIGSEREENAVIYRGLAPPWAKNCVNTSVSASKSGQNTAIYSVSCLPRFLEIAKTLWIPAVFAINPPKML